MDSNSLDIYIKSKDFQKDIVNDVEEGLTHQTTAKMIIDRFQQAGMKK